MKSLQFSKGWSFVSACRCVFFIYAAIGVLKLLFTLGMSKKVEATKKEDAHSTQQQGEQPSTEVDPLLGNGPNGEETPEPRRKPLLSIDRSLMSLVIRLAILFGLDSFASGLASLYVSRLLVYPC